MAQKDRYIPRRKEEPTIAFGQIILEWDKGTAVYARQSTVNQRYKNVAAAEIQSEELLEWAFLQGAPRDARTVLYDENIGEDLQYKAASGTLSIDQREKLSSLCERIEDDKVKVVVPFMVDRLFRDEFLIGPSYFMKLCKEHNCKIVLRTGMVYDFSIDWHQQQFFMEALAAANKLKMDKIRLHGSKMYQSRKGLYDGRFLSVGYIVDRRQYLPDGTPNPMWKRYIVYEPHAKVVLWLFVRFRDLDGNLGALCHEIEDINGGYIFPPFDSSVDKENQKIKLGERDPRTRKWLPPSPRGYRISRTGLVSLLTNRDYLGEWHSEGNRVQVDNHQPIVPDDLFYYAYNKLMEKEVKTTAQPRRNRGQGIALLDGIMTSPQGYCYVLSNTINGKRYQSYGVYVSNTLIGQKFLFTIDTEELDSLFMARFMDWYDTLPSPLPKDWKDEVNKPDKRQEAKRKQIIGQIAETNEKLAAIEVALDTLTLPALIQKKEEDYARLLAVKEGLEQELAKPVPRQARVILLEWEDTLRLLRFRPAWQEGPPLKILRDMVKALTTSIAISQVSSHWLQLDVAWLHPEWGHERAYIYRRIGSTPVWTPQDKERLREHYPMGEKDDLLAMFPDRSWSGLVSMASEIGVIRQTHKSKTAIPETLTWQDWQFMQEQDLSLSVNDLALSKAAYWSSSM